MAPFKLTEKASKGFFRWLTKKKATLVYSISVFSPHDPY